MMRNASGMACGKGPRFRGYEHLWKIFGPIVEKKRG